MEKSKITIKLEHFQNLVAVAYADGRLDIKEAEFLAQKAEEYNIKKELVDKIIDNAERLEFIVPANNIEKMNQLTDSVYMAMIDGEVDDREYDLCLIIAKKLDFDKNYLDEIIKLTKKLWNS